MMRNRSKTCYPTQKNALKGIMFLLCLLLPDYTAAECLCNLSHTTRQYRDQELENDAKEYIRVFTDNRTDTIKLRSSFNLTNEITNYAAKKNQSLEDFVLAGGLYDMSWIVFPLGSNMIYIDNRVLTDYVRNVYPSILKDNLRNRSKTFDYPLGAYRQPATIRNYNYTGLKFGNVAPSLCYCNASTGFSFTIQFRVNAPFEIKWDFTYFWTLNSTLYITDIELAVDSYASQVFGETYIHSSFENITTTNITMKLYFKGQYDLFWNSDTSEVNNKLRNMTTLHLTFLKTNLTLINPPRAIGCYSRVDYSGRECIKPTIPPTTSPTTTIMSSPLTTSEKGTFITTGTTDAQPSETTEMSSNPSTSNGASTTLANTVQGDGTSNPLSSTPSYLTTASNSNIMGNTTPIIATQQSKIYSTTNVPAYNITSSSTSTYTQLSTNYTTGSSLVPNQNVVNSTETVSSATGNTNNTITTDLPLVTTSNKTLSNNASSTTPFTDLSSTSLPQTPVNAFNAFQSLLNSTIAASTAKLPTGTTFDKDPLFLARVPVISKVYNDRILLKRVEGTVEYISDQGYFYTISIPAVLGILIITGLCLIICQIDWIACLAPKKTQVR